MALTTNYAMHEQHSALRAFTVA